jgi:hypothetical protein
MTDRTATPAISLWQPFASLIFAPEPFRKVHETRGFILPVGRRGQRHAIHASAGWPAAKHISGPLHRLCVEAFGSAYKYSLPRACVIGTVILLDCAPTSERRPASPAEEAAGNWDPDRLAWSLEDPVLLPTPFKAKGRQSWFSVQLPAGI